MTAIAGYGQLAYLSYPAHYTAAATEIHRSLALQGLIVLDPEPAAADDQSRAKLAALETAKLRRVDLVVAVHTDNGSLDDHTAAVVEFATTLGKRVTHLDITEVLHV